MAGTSLLTLLDDIASLLDDVATMSKVALQKTAGVVGDDLALNAKQIVGVAVDRELPVVWAVSKGSLLNKVILVPAALAISGLAPWGVTPLLMLGGIYLCYEGCEKLHHSWQHSLHRRRNLHLGVVRAAVSPVTTAEELAAFETTRIQGAVRTDFVLSAEIIVIALGTVSDESFQRQAAVLTAVALLMTVGVYGLVAAIIKLDDVGLFLSQRSGHRMMTRLQRGLGTFLVSSAPYLMKTLSIAGTAAMFMVGGGILTHGIPPLHHRIELLGEALHASPVAGPILSFLGEGAANALFGIVVGGLLLAIVNGIQSLRSKSATRGTV